MNWTWKKKEIMELSGIKNSYTKRTKCVMLIELHNINNEYLDEHDKQKAL